MGLYLAVFANDDDDEIDGVEVGGYDDFHTFRSAVQAHLEPDGWGSRFPTLMNHEDSRGTWSARDAERLETEMVQIRDAFQRIAARPINGGWQAEVASSLGLRPTSLHESFFDIDGQPLIDRLIELARVAQQHRQAIWFQ
jgi:hypothetical protein